MNAEDVRAAWTRRDTAYSPAYYAYHGPDERSEAVGRILGRHLEQDAAVLEIGCSAGRHLAHLHDQGFTDLHGIDINESAFSVMADTYPALADAGTFYRAAIESVVAELPDDRFDAVFSVETLQHIHPDDDWVYAELARIAEDLLVTVESEAPVGDGVPDETGVNYVEDDLPLYYRDWQAIFVERGMTAVAAESAGRDTLRVFRHR